MKTLPHRLVALALAALAWPAAAHAQPPEKPVPVLAEPNHKVTLENAYLRLIDVHFPPGQTTLYHIHTVPSVVVELSDSTIVAQEWGAAPAAVRHVVPGEARYAPYDAQPLTHRVTNVGQSVFHVLDIELLRPPASVDIAPAAASPEMKLEWEQKLVRLYKFSLAAGKQAKVAPGGCAHLLIGVSGTVQSATGSSGASAPGELKPGAYLFFAPGSRIQIDNRGQEAAACVLLELK